MNLENRSVNSLGFTPRQFFRIGAVSVTPEFFSRNLDDAPAPYGPWTMTFANTSGGTTNSASATVNLPLVNGSYKFNMTVQPGQTYYIDPEVAVGYDYAIGNPNFKSVSLPTDIGDGLYDIFGYDSLDPLVLLAHDWVGGSMFDFGADGVSRILDLHGGGRFHRDTNADQRDRA